MAKNKTSLLRSHIDGDSLLQNVVWWLLIIGSGLMFVYGLIMATPLGLIINLEESIDASGRDFTWIIKEMNPYINKVVIYGLIGVLLALAYRLTRSNVRKIFYISNVVYSVIDVIVVIGSSIFLYMTVAHYYDAFMSQDFENINFYLPLLTGKDELVYESHSWVFGVGYAVASVYILGGIANLALLIKRIPSFIKNFHKDEIVLNKKENTEEGL